MTYRLRTVGLQKRLSSQYSVIRQIHLSALQGFPKLRTGTSAQKILGSAFDQ